jgi:3-methyladenine DNA glycosylase AlkD
MAHAAGPDGELARQVMSRVVGAFEAARDDAAALAMRAYMRDQFAFLGIASPARVALCRDVMEGLPRPTAADLDAIARSCWDRPQREYQYFALWLLRRHAKVLEPDFLDTARTLLTTRSWWDTVDELAQNVVGPLVQRGNRVELMDTWIADEDIWLARTAILHQNRFKGDTDTARLFGYCEARAADTEFFIRKAIGWALREHSKTDAAAVRAFVAAHDRELSGLSKREALKWLDRQEARGAR